LYYTVIINKTQGKGFKMSCNARNGSVCTANEHAGRWGTPAANHAFSIQLCSLIYGILVHLIAINGFVWGCKCIPIIWPRKEIKWVISFHNTVTFPSGLLPYTPCPLKI